MSSLLLASPFLALVYLVYAIIQTLRKQDRPGLLGVALAFLAVLAPVVALALDTSGESLLTTIILVNAIAVFAASGVIMILDYRRPERVLGQSFGILGVGISVLLIAALYTTPLILSQLPGAAQTATDEIDMSFAGNPASGGLVPVTFNPGQQAGTDGTDTQSGQGQGQPGQPPGPSIDTTVLQTVLQNETGLTSDDLLTQLNAGSTLADLVTAAGRDLAAVTSALTEMFETAISDGSLPAPMLNQLGTDAAGMAENVLSGQAPPMLLSMLLGGAQGGPPAGLGGAGSDASNTDGPPQGFAGAAGVESDTSAAETQFQPPAAAGGDTEAQPFVFATATPTVEPTQVVLPTTVESTKLPTPTPFLFDMEPTATPIPAEPTALPTCSVIVQFNLNMRATPSADGEWILTIPAYTTVESTGQNADGWWQVTYDDETGWVSGDYLTAEQSCQALPAVD